MAYRKRKTEPDVPKIHPPPQKYPELGNDHTPQPIEQYWASIQCETQPNQAIMPGFDNTYEQLKFCQSKKIGREEVELKDLETSDKMLMKLVQDDDYPFNFDSLHEKVDDISKMYEVEKWNDDFVDKKSEENKKLIKLNKCLVWSHIPKELHLDYDSGKKSVGKHKKIKPKVAGNTCSSPLKNNDTSKENKALDDIFDEKDKTVENADNPETNNDVQPDIFSESESDDSQAGNLGGDLVDSDEELDGWKFDGGDNYAEDDKIDGF